MTLLDSEWINWTPDGAMGFKSAGWQVGDKLNWPNEIKGLSHAPYLNQSGPTVTPWIYPWKQWHTSDRINRS